MSTNSVLAPPVRPAADHDDTTLQQPVAQNQAPHTGQSQDSVAAGPGQPSFSAADAAELAARRAAQAKLEARLRGWKPLTIWYAFWAVVIGIGAISSLAAGQAGTFFVGVAICAGCVKYTHYLYNGGRRRVWFFIW